MKCLLTIWLLTLFLVTSSYAQVDTVVVQVTHETGHFFPLKPRVFGKINSPSIGDSLWVGFTYFLPPSDHYYLIARDAGGQVRLQGNFTGKFADGWVVEYSPKGALQSRTEYRIKTNKKPVFISGDYKEYDEAVRHGKELMYTSGVLRIERHFQDGLLHGMVKVFNADGALRRETTYEKGKQKGKVRHHSPNGELIRETRR